MGLRTIEGTEIGRGGTEPTRVVWFCSTSEWALGPVFDSVEEADAFEAYVWREAKCDPRRVETKQLVTMWRAFRGHAATEPPTG